MNAKDVTKKNFSRYAGYYDAHSNVQNQAGRALATGITAEKIESILDIGCGTGNYTQLLRYKFPTAKITAVDICDEMIEVAKRKLAGPDIDFIVADAETIEPARSFDLITSNASFQWFDEPEKAITQYKNFLAENGIISFSIFGPQTFYRLNESLEQLYQKDVQISSSIFIGAEKLSAILEENFDNVSINRQIFKQPYGSLLKLLQAIKYTGTRGVGLSGRTLNKKKINQLEEIYRNRFGDITATYEILYCCAKRKA